MAQGIQFTSYIPTSLVGVNSPSPTLAADPITGTPTYTGAFPGNCFYLSESQAQQLSLTTVNNAVPLDCHAGWYMVAKVDASAVAANILAGAVGAQVSIPTTAAASQASIPPAAVVTDGATAGTAGLGLCPVVFLGTVTAGNYTIVQISGDGNLLLAASQTTAIGSVLTSQTPGNVVTQSTINGTTLKNVAGLAEAVTITPAAALVLTSVAASSGGVAVYTGTITGGGTNNFVGQRFTIAGFAKGSNNGVFVATANDTTTLTLANTVAVAETHAGTATALNLVRAQISFPFGIV